MKYTHKFWFLFLLQEVERSLQVLDGGGHILFSPVSVDASLLPQTLWPVVPEVVRKAGGFGLPGNYSGL